MPRRRSLRKDRRGTVAVFFALSILTLMTAIGVGINMAQLASLRAGLQRSVDSAALSGAAAYSANSPAFNTLAIQMATRVFCNTASKLPMGATVSAQAGSQACSVGSGPVVTAITDSYVPGTPGLTAGHCTGTYLPALPYLCGFIVTVSASATLPPLYAFLFGSSSKISATAMAANPFINFARIFSLPNGVSSTAKYANSLWVYPLQLNSSGTPNYTSANPGARPDDSSCIGGTGSVAAAGGPDQVACGSYVMLASTMYASKGLNYKVTIQGVTTTYNNGVVANPVTPTFITATTPLGFAFRSIAGGNYLYGSGTTPGVYGYSVSNLGAGSTSVQYNLAPSGCIYPYYSLAYNTVGQTWSTVPAKNGEPGYLQNLPWSTLVTHWFYSSYLANGLPPSQTQINIDNAGPQSLPSVPSDPAQAGGNIYNGYGASGPTYNPSPNPVVPATCPATTQVSGVAVPNAHPVTPTYPTTGNTNCSLYVGVSTTATYVPPSASYTGSCFSPTSTPGQQYAAISCQAYGLNYYTFYWNDMGGAAYDDENYGDGVVQIGCNGGGAHVALIN